MERLQQEDECSLTSPDNRLLKRYLEIQDIVSGLPQKGSMPRRPACHTNFMMCLEQ